VTNVAQYGTSRVGRWERRTEWPLAAAAALFFAAYAWPTLDEHLAHHWRVLCDTVDYTAWALFVVDYLVRLAIADQRWHYFWRHLVDLVIIALPVLRPLRLLRLILLLKVLNRRATDSLRGRVITYTAGASSLLLITGALAVLNAERHARGANIRSFGDALWWAVTTISTVGYGDRYPVTIEGRFVAVGLMIGGIALLGVITASIASWLVDRVRQVEQDLQAVTRKDLAQVMAELRALRRQLDTLTSAALPSGRATAGASVVPSLPTLTPGA
jgi:voltage-gated potassium channel